MGDLGERIEHNDGRKGGGMRTREEQKV